MKHITKESHPHYWDWLHEVGMPWEGIRTRGGFRVDEAEYQKHRAEAEEALPKADALTKDAWALHITRTHPGFHKASVPPPVHGPTESAHMKLHINLTMAIVILLVVIAILLVANLARGQERPPIYAAQGKEAITAQPASSANSSPILPTLNFESYKTISRLEHQRDSLGLRLKNIQLTEMTEEAELRRNIDDLQAKIQVAVNEAAKKDHVDFEKQAFDEDKMEWIQKTPAEKEKKK